MKCIADEKGYGGPGVGIVQAGQQFDWDGPECPGWASEVVGTAGSGTLAPPADEMTKDEIAAKLDEMTILQAELANPGDGETLSAIQQVQDFKTLYTFQTEGRSANIDNAINRRGMELVKQAADAAEPPLNASVDLSGAPSNTTLGG
jgi:hypothetical protein